MSNESIHIFGKHKNLQGISTEPQLLKCSDTAVIILNAGIIHKIGPFNLNVDLSRKLAAEGYLSFRFDFSGLGDSYKLKDGGKNEDVVMDDIKQAMSYIEVHFGFSKFIVIGLCTGADHAYKISLVDERVVGNVWLDGYGYPTKKFYLKRYFPILLSPIRMFNVLKGLLLPSKSRPNYDGADSTVWKLPSKESYVRNMQELYLRRFKSLYIFSGGIKSYYNYKDQYKDGFSKQPFWNNVEVEYYPEFDHTYVIINDRNIMIKRIKTWLDRELLD